MHSAKPLMLGTLRCIGNSSWITCMRITWILKQHHCVCQISSMHLQKAKKFICQCAMISDESVTLHCRSYQKLYTLWTEKKPLLSLLSIKHLSGTGARKATVVSKWCQNFWTKHFQQKPHLENTMKNPKILYYWRTNEVCRHTHTCTLTLTHTDAEHELATVPLAHAPMVNNIIYSESQFIFLWLWGNYDETYTSWGNPWCIYNKNSGPRWTRPVWDLKIG